jgi:hypothetical protein
VPPPQPSAPTPRRRLAKRHRIGEYHCPPRGDDGDCAWLAVTWRRVPDEGDDIGAALPQVGRARGHRRSGAWAGGGPCRSRGQET